MGRWWQGRDGELASDYLVSRPKAEKRGDIAVREPTKNWPELCLSNLFSSLYIYRYSYILLFYT